MTQYCHITRSIPASSPRRRLLGFAGGRRLRALCCVWTIFGILTFARAAAAQQVEIPEALVKLIDQAEVASLEAGVLSSIDVREGDQVKAGSRLAQLDAQDAELLLARAESEYEIASAEARSAVKIQLAQATLDAATAELERARESIRKFPRSVSPSELDRFELSQRQAELAIRQAEHEQEVARLTLELRDRERAIAQRQVARRRIEAPFDGTVVQLYRRPGEWVEPGEKVLRLVRTDRVRAEGFLPAAEARRAKIGSPAELVLGEGEKFTGKLTFVSPEVDPVTKQVQVLAEFDNRRLELRPGLTARLIIKP